MHSAEGTMTSAAHKSNPVRPSYYGARYYDPSSGRFLREDPVRFTGGVNFYLYARNNPTNLVDPRGLWGGGVIANASAEAGLVADSLSLARPEPHTSEGKPATRRALLGSYQQPLRVPLAPSPAICFPLLAIEGISGTAVHRAQANDIL